MKQHTCRTCRHVLKGIGELPCRQCESDIEGAMSKWEPDPIKWEKWVIIALGLVAVGIAIRFMYEVTMFLINSGHLFS